MLRFAAPLVAIPMLALVMVQAPTFDAELAPMLIEAQLDRANSFGRRTVTACLQQQYDQSTIMASMGSLGHYMQELSREVAELRQRPDVVAVPPGLTQREVEEVFQALSHSAGEPLEDDEGFDQGGGI